MRHFSKEYSGKFDNPYWRKSALKGGTVYCPEQDDDVLRVDCVDCQLYGVWREGDLEMCKHEYEERKRNGLYAETEEEWLAYLEQADPETWQKLIEEQRNHQRVREEMEAEDWIRHEEIEDEAEDAGSKTATEEKDEKYEKHQDKDERDEEDEEEEEDYFEEEDEDW